MTTLNNTATFFVLFFFSFLGPARIVIFLRLGRKQKRDCPMTRPCVNRAHNGISNAALHYESYWRRRLSMNESKGDMAVGLAHCPSGGVCVFLLRSTCWPSGGKLSAFRLRHWGPVQYAE